MANARRKLTLVELAKRPLNQCRATKATPEQVDLAIAWAKDEVSSSGVAMALLGNKRSHTNAFFYMAMWLRQAVRDRRLVVRR